MPLKILSSAWLLGFAMFSPMFCVPPITHILEKELLFTHSELGLLFSAPILMVVAFAIPAGVISDKIGVRKATRIGVILLAIGALLRYTADSAFDLLLFTFIYGAGFGWCYPNLAKLVSEYIPFNKSGMAMGIISTGILCGCGLALAITMNIIFPLTNSYQGVFLIWGMIPVIAAIVWWIFVQKPETVNMPELDPASNISFSSVIYNRQLWILTSIFFFHNIFFYTWSGWVPTLLIQKQATPGTAGIITSFTIWAGIPASLLMPRFAYKVGLRKPFIWIPGIALAIATLGITSVALNMSWVITVTIGIAIMTQFPTILALPVEMVDKKDVGAASGLLTSVGYIGGFIGPIIGGRILDITRSLNLAFFILVIVSIAIICITFALKEPGFVKR